MDRIENVKIAEVFNNYPEEMHKRLMFLRHLILETASEIQRLNKLEETLKWGEPSYLTKSGCLLPLTIENIFPYWAYE